MRTGEALQLARLCRQQSHITTDQMAAAVLVDLAERYEALARPTIGPECKNALNKPNHRGSGRHPRA